MNGRFHKIAVILLLVALALLNVCCQKNGQATDSFTADDVYGKWECYKINTLWKSMPDSVTNEPVEPLYNLFKITTDSLLNYVKTAAIPCYIKTAIGVSYSTNPNDTLPHDSTLSIGAMQAGDGILLQYNYAKTDSIREYFLQKIDTVLNINVCDYGIMPFKARVPAPVKVPLVIRPAIPRAALQNSVSWF
jgi:hypothetical protein